ncbi:MAG: signal peptidase I, partial [Acidobacteriota bacterium]
SKAFSLLANSSIGIKIMLTAIRKPWLAGLLSLLKPGLGQIYNGQVKRGLLFYCLFWVVYFAAVLTTIALPFPFKFAALILMLIAAYLFYLYVILDSIRNARRLGDTYQLKSYNKWYMYLGIYVLLSLVQIAFEISGREVLVQAYNIPSGSMIPTLQIGDRILVNNLTYGVHIPFRSGYIAQYSKPKRGDVVVYVYPKDRSKGFLHRVIGEEGDLVEIRKTKVYINGQHFDDPYAHLWAKRYY